MTYGQFIRLIFTIGSYVLLTGCEISSAKGPAPQGPIGSPGPTQSGAEDDSPLLDGWTDFPPSSDSRIVYVSSSSGNDSNSGLSPSSPKRTILGGVALLRDGYPDHLLLKKGDRFEETGLRNIFGSWQHSGRSPEERMVISSYGDGFDPILTCPDNPCMRIWSRQNLAIIGLDFYKAERDPEAPEYLASSPYTNPLEIYYDSHNIWIEGNKFRFFSGLNIQVADGGVRPSHITIRRNIITDNWANGTHAQGIYLGKTDHVLIEENIFDHNGWYPLAGANPTIFNHNLYAESPTNLIIRKNLSARGSSMGFKLRTDLFAGVENLSVEDNLILENPIGISLGGNIPQYEIMYVNARVRGNVITQGGRDLPNGTNYGITLGGAEDVRIENNYLVHNPYSSNVKTIDIANLAMIDVIVRENRIFNFNFANIENHAAAGVSLVNNYVEGHTPNLNFLDPQRSVSSYMSSIGGSYSSDEYIERARNQSYRKWKKNLAPIEVVNYIKEGFQIVP